MGNDIMNCKGFTLVEIMVAFVILLLASQLLITGAAAAKQMEKRANELDVLADKVQEQLMDESMCIPGKLRVELENGVELTGDGWLYRYQDESNSSFTIEAVHVGDSIQEALMEIWEEEE